MYIDMDCLYYLPMLNFTSACCLLASIGEVHSPHPPTPCVFAFAVQCIVRTELYVLVARLHGPIRNVSVEMCAVILTTCRAVHMFIAHEEDMCVCVFVCVCKCVLGKDLGNHSTLCTVPLLPL